MKSQKPITLGSKSQDNSAQFRELIVADCRHGRCVERASSIDDTLLQQRPNEVMYGREIFSMTGVNDSMFGFLARLSLDHLRFSDMSYQEQSLLWKGSGFLAGGDWLWSRRFCARIESLVMRTRLPNGQGDSA